MNKILIIAVLMFGSIINVKSQIQPSITYDSLSGDYIIRYQGSQGIIEEYFVPATKINPLVNATIDKKFDTLKYSYKITNNLSSKQRLLNFSISICSPIFAITRPNAQWHSNPAIIIPGWNWGHTLVNPTGAATADNGISPGFSEDGFSFMSFGLPSIVKSYFQGRTGIMNFEEEPPIEVEELLEPLQKFPANEVMRKTIAPADPPFPFNGLIFIDTIKSYIYQSRELGWIAADSVKNKYLSYFDSARIQLTIDTTGRLTRNTLLNVLRDVELDSTNVLTSEAYALIRFNTEYLIEQLPRAINLLYKVDTLWNMLSIPVELIDYKKSTIYPNSLSSAYIYQQGFGYIPRDTLTNGVGFWIKFGMKDTVKYKGFEIEKDTINVSTGWNLIGTISTILDTGQIRTIPEGILTSKLFGYRRDLGYYITDKLYPGRAYWLKAGQSGKLILGRNLLSGGGQGGGALPPPPPGSPEVPELYLPLNGTTNVSRTPTLQWYESNNAQIYHLQVSTNLNFTTLVYNDSTLTTTTKQIGPLSNGTTYYWRVRSKNDIWTSGWSSIWWFRTQGGQIGPCETIEALAMMDEVTIADASGNKQRLYLYNSGRRLAFGLRENEMPPEPIGEIPHIRFQSGKFVESIPPNKSINKIPIKIKDAKLPLTIIWNIKPESKTKYWLYKTKSQKIELTGSGNAIINKLDGNIMLIEAQAVLPGPCY